MSVMRQCVIPILALAFLSIPLAGPGELEAGSATPHVVSPEGSGWLGISIQEITEGIKEAAGLTIDNGVLINEVFEGSTAEEAGLEPGDIILEFEGEEVEDVRHLVRLVRESEPGDQVHLTILRDRKEEEVAVEVGERKGEFEHELFGEGGPRPPRHEGHEPFSYSYTLPHFGGPRIGVKVQDLNPQLAEAMGLKEAEGTMVIEADEDGPAYEAGIRGGDVIVEVDGEEVEGKADLRSIVGEKEDGDEVAVTVIRKGAEQTFTVKVEESPGLSVIKERIEGFDLDDEIEELKDIRIEVQTEIEEKVAKLREELDALKKELEELKKD